MTFLNFIYIDVNDKLHDLEQEIQTLKMNIEYENDDIACKNMKNTIWKNTYNIRMGYKIMDLIEEKNESGVVYYLNKFYQNSF
jgi:hypothetical protein